MDRTKKPTRKQVEEIGQRMHDQAMRLHQKKTAIIERKQNLQEKPDLECTHQPNLTKKRFVKYPDPFKVHPSKDTIFDDSRTYSRIDVVDSINRSKQLKAPKASQKYLPTASAANLNSSLEKTQQKVTSLYNWNYNKQQKLKSRFLDKQLNKSFEELTHSATKVSHGMNATRLLNGSLENLHIKGTEDFYVRQRKADIMRREKEYLRKFPSSYIYTYREKFETSMDSAPTHYLSFGQYSQTRR